MNLGDNLLQLGNRMLYGHDLETKVTEKQKGCCALELSFNGEDFTKDMIPYKYDEVAVVLSVSPPRGSVGRLS